MERIRRGWSLTKQSWAVLRSDRSLAAFPVLGGLATILLAAAFGLLYRFAVGEGATGAFSEADLAGAVAPKGGSAGTI